jgi:hypothetical protein
LAAFVWAVWVFTAVAPLFVEPTYGAGVVDAVPRGTRAQGNRNNFAAQQ